MHRAGVDTPLATGSLCSAAVCAARSQLDSTPVLQVGSLLVRHFRASVARGLALSARKWASHTAAAEAGRLAPVVESLATRCRAAALLPCIVHPVVTPSEGCATGSCQAPASRPQQYPAGSTLSSVRSFTGGCVHERRYLGPDYGDAGAVGERDAVTAAQVPGLARQSFPLCMALMTQHLHAEHHLRHGGRIQLGLFLKVKRLPLLQQAWRNNVAASGAAHVASRHSRSTLKGNSAACCHLHRSCFRT